MLGYSVSVFAYSLVSGADPHGYGIVTDRFLCLLGFEASSEVAIEVYRLLDGDDATANDAVDLLATQRSLPRFAVVEVLDPVKRTFAVVVRGQVSIDLEQASATRLSGGSDAAWISTEAKGVQTMRLMLSADLTPGASLPIRKGVVPTNYLSLDQPTLTVAPTKPKRVRAPRVSSQTAVPPDVSDQWVLTLPDGSQVDVGLPVIVGRRPWAAGDDREVVHVVAPANGYEISGTHLELSVADGVVVARDLNSTNGTIVRTTARPPRHLHSGGITTLAAGDILDVGEDYSIVLGARE